MASQDELTEPTTSTETVDTASSAEAVDTNTLA